MFAKIFKTPTLTGTFTDDFLLATDRISSYEYTKRWTKTGDFTLVFPFDKEILNALNLNGIIYIDGDWLFIQNVSYNGRQISVTGKDCKAFLETRIALPNNTGYTGYSSVSGTTAQCIEYYLNLNCINPVDVSRKLPLMFAGGTAGISNDSYMARFEYISDIVTAMCENAGIGFDIRGNILAEENGVEGTAGYYGNPDTTCARMGYVSTSETLNISSDGGMKFLISRDFSENTAENTYSMTETDFSPSSPANLGTATNIFLDSPLGDGDYIDFHDQKRYNSDNTSAVVSLPAISTENGINILDIDTTVTPLKIGIQGDIDTSKLLYINVDGTEYAGRIKVTNGKPVFEYYT